MLLVVRAHLPHHARHNSVAVSLPSLARDLLGGFTTLIGRHAYIPSPSPLLRPAEALADLLTSALLLYRAVLSVISPPFLRRGTHPVAAERRAHCKLSAPRFIS